MLEEASLFGEEACPCCIAGVGGYGAESAVVVEGYGFGGYCSAALFKLGV